MKPARMMPASFCPIKGILGCRFRLPDIQEHDDKQEQHHDGPGVDDHLDGGDELGVGQEVDACHRKEVDDEPEGAPQGVLLKDHQAAGNQGHGAQDEKQDLHPSGLLFLPNWLGIRADLDHSQSPRRSCDLLWVAPSMSRMSTCLSYWASS